MLCSVVTVACRYNTETRRIQKQPKKYDLLTSDFMRLKKTNPKKPNKILTVAFIWTTTPEVKDSTSHEEGRGKRQHSYLAAVPAAIAVVVAKAAAGASVVAATDVGATADPAAAAVFGHTTQSNCLHQPQCCLK